MNTFPIMAFVKAMGMMIPKDQKEKAKLESLRIILLVHADPSKAVFVNLLEKMQHEFEISPAEFIEKLDFLEINGIIDPTNLFELFHSDKKITLSEKFLVLLSGAAEKIHESQTIPYHPQ